MKGPLRLLVGAIALGGTLSAPAQAYQQRLSSEAIREAYFLGSRNDEITVDFWNHYERIFTSPSAALHVGAIEVLTPYAQVVLAAQRHMTDENAVDAVQKYGGRSLPFLVRVTINYPGNALPDQYDVENDASIVVTQDSPLKPRKVTYLPEQAPVGKSGTRSVGTQIELQFDAAQISSSNLKIRVTFQDGRPFETIFDLARLK